MLALQLDSPESPLSSPKNNKILSADLAAIMACSKNEVSVLRTSLYPFSKVIFVDVRACFKLVRGVIESCAFPSGAQQPI